MKTAEYRPVPVVAAMAIADGFDKDVVVIVSIDRAAEKTHFTSYGKSPADKIEAATISDWIARKAGFPKRDDIPFEDFRTVDAADRALKIEKLRIAVDWFIQKLQGDSGTGHSYWCQFPEYRAAIEALKLAGGPDRGPANPELDEE